MSKIGPLVILKGNPIINENVEIGPFSIIGKLSDGSQSDKVILSNSVRILSRVTLYKGCWIGPSVMIADDANIREYCRIGARSVIGRKVILENNTVVGSHVLIHSQCHITAHALIEDYVFMGPNCTTVNDKVMVHERRDKLDLVLKGPTIRRGARIGGGSIILPDVVIGREAVIGAGSVVTRDIPSGKVAYGNPARVKRDVDQKEFLESE